MFFVGLLLQRGTKIFLYEHVAKNLLFFIVKNRRRNRYFSCVLILGARMCVHTLYGLTISLNRFIWSFSIWRMRHPNKTNKISMPSRASLDILAQAIIIAFKSDGSQIFINKMETPVKLECLLVESKFFQKKKKKVINNLNTAFSRKFNFQSPAVAFHFGQFRERKQVEKCFSFVLI